MNTSRIHNPVINPAFYTSRSVPTAPLDPGTAEFVKGKPAIAQPAKTNAYYIQRLKQHLDDFDRDLAEWKASGEWKKEYKTWGAACELALDMARQSANRIIRHYKESTTSQSVETEPKCSAGPDTDKAHTLDQVNNLPPVETRTQRMNRELAESMQEEKPRVVARAPVNGHKVKMGEVLENGENVTDYKRPIAPRTESGKPIHMMAIWNEVEGLYGKALNRLDEINRLSRHPVLHALTIEGTKKVMKDVSEWREIAKKSHHA